MRTSNHLTSNIEHRRRQKSPLDVQCSKLDVRCSHFLCLICPLPTAYCLLILYHHHHFAQICEVGIGLDADFGILGSVAAAADLFDPAQRLMLEAGGPIPLFEHHPVSARELFG